MTSTSLASLFVLEGAFAGLQFYSIDCGVANYLLIILLLVHFPCRFVFSPLYLSHALNGFGQSPSALQHLAAVCVSMGLSMVFKIPELPSVTGKYAIGCTVRIIRGLETRVFYPTQVAGDVKTTKISYLHFERHLAHGLGSFTKLPALMFRHFRHSKLDANENTPMLSTSKRWPVFIFSHGLGGTLEMYSNIVQEIASHGFVVAALNHNDGSASVTRGDDGEIQYYQHLPSEDLKDDDKLFQIRNKQLKKRVEEIFSVTEGLTDLAESSLLDFNQIFVGGHSFGAATAVQSAWIRKDTYKSVVMLDGWMFPIDKKLMDNGFGDQIPVYHLISDQFFRWSAHMDLMRRLSKGCRHENSQLLLLKDSSHQNFSDIGLFYSVSGSSVDEILCDSHCSTRWGD